MGFLVITCIQPIKGFLGCFSLPCSMIVMAIIIVAITGYTYLEADVYFAEMKLFGVLTKEIYAIIEFGVALLLFFAFLIKNKIFVFFLYLLTLAFAGFALVINIHKLEVIELEQNISDENERLYIKWLYFIRIGAEFILEMVVCYMCYSYKSKLKLKL